MNVAIIFAFTPYFVFRRIKEVTVWEIKWPHVTSDVVVFDSYARVLLFVWYCAEACWPLCILYEKDRLSSCSVCLIRDSNTPVSVAMALIDFEGSFSIMVLISLTNSGNIYFYQNEQSEFLELPYHRNHHCLHCPQIDTQTLWNVFIGASGTNARQYSMSCSNLWTNILLHGAASLTDGAQLTLLLYFAVDKKEKQRTCTQYQI